MGHVWNLNKTNFHWANQSIVTPHKKKLRLQRFHSTHSHRVPVTSSTGQSTRNTKMKTIPSLLEPQQNFSWAAGYCIFTRTTRTFQKASQVDRSCKSNILSFPAGAMRAQFERPKQVLYPEPSFCLRGSPLYCLLADTHCQFIKWVKCRPSSQKLLKNER